MSTLKDTEKRYLEKLLRMESGYVLDYKDASFGEFFRRFGIDIHGKKYLTNGPSKAKKMRSFWEQEDDQLVGKVLSAMLDSYEVECELNDEDINEKLLLKSSEAVARLLGEERSPASIGSEKSFLSKDFETPDLRKLPIETASISIFESRLDEARRALLADAHLSVIFLCGSVLEGVLLGAAMNDPEKFNRAKSSAKDRNGNVKKFQNWTLSELINTACELRIIQPDIQKFSHGLRDFRNYIHPYEQMVSGFTPDEHTAKVCFHVLKAALASLAGER